ncbi:EVE domain-containing protein [Mariniphaga sp.]|uniref:EVE domain-containing protein n=1 Tax=Mariniphaga sp. TaxID=1954475 RepID=UPI003567037F
MKYYLDLFSPETYEKYTKSDQTISGFRPRQLNAASKIKPGDKLLCYVTRLSRWVGILEVTSKNFEDNTPIFVESDDPFVIRFKVKPTIWLPLEKAVPIKEDFVWDKISFTKDHDKNSSVWTGPMRVSQREMSASDGKFIEQLLEKQMQKSKLFEFSEDDLKKLKNLTVRTHDSKDVPVSIPEDEDVDDNVEDTTVRESIKMQAMLAKIGERMNLKVWIPRSDRERVMKLWKPLDGTLLENLPLNYDDTTLKTIENIDVLWIRRRSIVRAFEVEHTTSIYSGILRMADLMALQPNLDIKAHIVAPTERKDKVLQEITRPVFTLLEKGPLAKSCSFLSYDSLTELSKERRLEYMNDGVIEEYTEDGEI